MGSRPLRRPLPGNLTDRPPRGRSILLRGIVWGMVGLIYAPLFIALVAILERLGTGQATYVVAAALAGAAGAALYGAHELALVGSGVGVAVGLLLLILVPDLVSFEQGVLIAAALSALLGLLVAFPGHCTRQVPGKVLAGLSTGACCGLVVAVAEPLHPHPFSIFSLLAVLVSANGVLYVAAVRWWVALSRRWSWETRACRLIEALVLAALAGLAAGSVRIMAGPLLGESAGLVGEVAAVVYDVLPLALLGGIFGGAVAGALLEAFGFAWVNDV
jgi:hypothetical protein